ncbi:MAG: OmpA family protein [Halocynthiibacter sp.]
MNIQKAAAFLFVVIFSGAALASLFTAYLAATVLEERTEKQVQEIVLDAGLNWAQVDTSGLRVTLKGTAPDEVSRFRAMTEVGSVIDSNRIVDHMDVEAAKAIAAPKFSIEILRNASGISLIGLVPSQETRDALIAQITGLAGAGTVTDLLESAEYPTPSNWNEAVKFGLDALEALEQSKVSISADRIAVTAITNSFDLKKKFETQLTNRAPDGIKLSLNITAPKPVISPFTLRAISQDGAISFDACAYDSPEALIKIIKAAKSAGFDDTLTCVEGLGVPSPTWGDAVAVGLSALKKIPTGSITFSDADITLVADASVKNADFDRIRGELESNLPDLFSLHTVLQKSKEEKKAEAPDFTATKSPEGLVQLRGRLTNVHAREATIAFAKAEFGANNIYAAPVLDDALPLRWSIRVLAGLDALGELNNGVVTITTDRVVISGQTGNPNAKDAISRILSEKLGEAEDFTVDTTYEKKLDPVLNLPSPKECVERLNTILSTTKLSFAPGKATLAEGTDPVIAKLAGGMKDCTEFSMEIGGHTDSQGSEEFNQRLSEGRARAVLNAILGKNVITSALNSKGYGESQPIAENDTEAGRETNRRIEFKLLEDVDSLKAGAQKDTPDE